MNNRAIKNVYIDHKYNFYVHIGIIYNIEINYKI